MRRRVVKRLRGTVFGAGRTRPRAALGAVAREMTPVPFMARVRSPGQDAPSLAISLVSR